MKVNHNMAATITNAQLLKTENSLSAAMERLSSGLKINHAKDDPAGMAISNKMQAQIDGLAQASQNASNGISVMQIADTALSEITSMIQRMRELAVQAATDTNQLEDREAMQEEIESLIAEVDRISRDTEYNTKKLLDGTSDIRVYCDGISRMAISDTVKTGEYKLTINTAATQSYAVTETQTGTVPEGSIVINGYEIKISGGESAASLFEKLREGADKADVSLILVDNPPSQDYEKYPSSAGFEAQAKEFNFGDTLAFISNQFGSSSAVDITCSSDDLKQFLGLDAVIDQLSGKDATVTLDLSAQSSFGAQATLTMDGNKFRITDVGGFEMNFMVDAGYEDDLNIEVTDIGTMTLQIGANEHQTMDVRIPEVSAATLYLDEIDVTRVNGGDKAISRLDTALEIVSSVRSAIGAYQNRLEYAVDSLDASGEDMTQAISRISDADMAAEMTEYTKYTVLQQAATAVLAQANDIPQTVLQLLQ